MWALINSQRSASLNGYHHICDDEDCGDDDLDHVDDDGDDAGNAE